MRNIKRRKVANAPYSSSAFYGPKRKEFVTAFEGGIGLYITISYYSAGRILVTVGINTIPGLTIDLGHRY